MCCNGLNIIIASKTIFGRSCGAVFFLSLPSHQWITSANEYNEEKKREKQWKKSKAISLFMLLMRKRLTNSFNWLLHIRFCTFIFALCILWWIFFLKRFSFSFSLSTYRKLKFFFFIFCSFLDLCKRAINDLQRSKTVEQKPDGKLSILPFGVVMAKYFLSIPTIVAFQQVSQFITKDLWVLCDLSITSQLTFCLFL